MALEALTLLKTEGSRAAAVARGATTSPSACGVLSDPLPAAISSEVVRSYRLSTSVLAVFLACVGATSAPCGEMSSFIGVLTGAGERWSDVWEKAVFPKSGNFS